MLSNEIPNRARTLLDKIWDTHTVLPEGDAPALLYIDLHLVHEVTSPQAFDGLRRRGLRVRRPDLTLATVDHSVPTIEPVLPMPDRVAARQVEQLGQNCADYGIPCYGIGHPRQGIVHIIGPELGATQPGMTIVCGDSHTATHGAFGALAFGIGTSEVETVLASQCLLQRRPHSFCAKIEGSLPIGVTAKDIILALIKKVGMAGGTGCVFEYAGSTVRALSMDERMTICNMSIEAGARAGLVAPDDTTFEFLAGRPFAPGGEAWDRALDRWRRLPTDEDAVYDLEMSLEASRLEPMITFGTNPGTAIPVTERIPDPRDLSDAQQRDALAKALQYMNMVPGKPILGQPVQVVFLGSCTNSRLSDLRAAASILRGRKIHQGVRMLVVPGSARVKAEAEAEGLHEVFRAAGAEWRLPGCSMCIAMNGDEVAPGEYCVSTSNRNFEGRQGKGSRTFLASPLTAAACALEGRVSDVRRML